jgi:uncharacterized protein (TIGR02270 family)
MIRNQIITDVIEEYLEEAAFLYEHRCNLYDNPEVAWPELQDFENRLEAHLDGLVLAETVGLEACRQRVRDSNPFDIFTAVCVFCRQQQKEMLLELLDQIDLGDPACLAAVTDALKHEAPAQWQPDILDFLASGHAGKCLVAAKVIGFQRLPAGEQLVQAILKKDAMTRAALAWALGRIGHAGARDLLYDQLTRVDDEKAGINTALALLRLGDSRSLDHCMAVLKGQPWPALPLGLADGRSALGPLRDLAGTHPEGLIALGLLGDMNCVDFLIFQLENPDLAEFAALALNLISGAELYEEIVVSEAVASDEGPPEEDAHMRSSRTEEQHDAAATRTTLRRLSQSAGEWRGWCRDHLHEFDPQVRYRSGRPYSPAVLLESLVSEHSPPMVRHMACEELVIRYGLNVNFETDMYVEDQILALGRYKEAIAAADGRFKAGCWYFAGHLLV